MARLPQVNDDNDQWGSILNDFLSQSLNTDGTLKTAAVGTGLPTSVENTQSVATTDVANALQTNYLPSALVMRQVHNQRLFNWPISEKSPGLILNESMIGADLSRYVRFTRGGVPTTTVNADGSVTVAADASGVATVDFISGDRPRMCAFAAEVTVKAGFATADVSGIEVGLYKQDTTGSIWGYYNGTGCGVFAVGTGPTTGGPSPAQPTAFTIDTTKDLVVGAFFKGPEIIVYIRQGDRTAFVTRSTANTLDGTHFGADGTSLAGYRLGFTLAPVASKSLTVTKFAAAYMPGTAFFNPRVVTHKDGTPYVRNGLYYFTGAISESGNADFVSQSNALFSFDPTTYRAELVSHLFFNVPALGGNVHCSPVGVFFDKDANQWVFFGASWAPGSASAGVDFIYGTTQKDIIRSGVYIVPAVLCSPDNAHSYYDPAVRWDAVAGKWRVAAIQTNSRTGWTSNYPVYLEASGAANTNLQTLSVIRTDTGHDAKLDGAQWAQIGGVWYVIYGGMTHFVSYDTNVTAASYTALPNWDTNVPSGVFNGFGGFMPHAAVIPVAEDGPVTRYLVLSYGADLDQLGGRGSLVVLEADQQPVGWEMPRRIAAGGIFN